MTLEDRHECGVVKTTVAAELDRDKDRFIDKDRVRELNWIGEMNEWDR